jgi:L-2-hydroxyglutarate oxidase LhgO
MSFVRGDENVDFLRKRYEELRKRHLFAGMCIVAVAALEDSTLGGINPWIARSAQIICAIEVCRSIIVGYRSAGCINETLQRENPTQYLRGERRASSAWHSPRLQCPPASTSTPARMHLLRWRT